MLNKMNKQKTNSLMAAFHAETALRQANDTASPELM